MPLARPAYERRTGATYYGAAARRARREGGALQIFRAESKQYRDRVVKVKAYRRSHPGGPPGDANVHVVKHWRTPPHRDWLADQNKRDWIDYLAGYYHITKSEARRMERETR
jgi:hypothetical protein